jgi:hypothetical protein
MLGCELFPPIPQDDERMPVYYDIFPDLNLVVYVCTETVTPIDFFKAGDTVALDPRLKEKMMVIIDFFYADLETSVSDLYLAITKDKEAKQRGQKIGRTAVLTTSAALKYMGNALRLLSMDAVTNFGIFHTEQDVIDWLGLPEKETRGYWSELRKKMWR